jgi:3-dehydroquinate synthetase
LPEDLSAITSFILRTYGKIKIAKDEFSAIAQLTFQDKKNKNNKIMCVLLEGIGKAKWDCAITPEQVAEALSFYQES